LCGGKICNVALGEVCINDVCGISFCSDFGCPVNSTCFNRKDHGECVCNPGFVDIRNVSSSLRLAAGFKEDQYCLRPVDVDWCALGLHDCPLEVSICVPLRGNYTCKCKDGYTDQNTTLPGRDCLAIVAASPIVVSPAALSNWLLMLLLALLFLLLTLW
jgi:hypothetical protein